MSLRRVKNLELLVSWMKAFLMNMSMLILMSQKIYINRNDVRIWLNSSLEFDDDNFSQEYESFHMGPMKL